MSQQKMVLQPILRLWLGLFSGLLLVSAISAFHGEYWYFGDKQAFYAAKAGEVSVHELYTPAKILFAFIVSTIPPLLWLLLVGAAYLYFFGVPKWVSLILLTLACVKLLLDWMFTVWYRRQE